MRRSIACHPHGVRYSLTLHDRNNARVVGFDNAHAIKTKGRKRFSGRKVTWDHKYHMDKVEPYKFESAGQLIDDFWRPLTGRPEDDAMRKNVMKIGILSKDDYRKRTIAIAKGEYKPKKNEPTVWFESMESLGQILSGQNQRLLRIIRDSAPGSLTELEEVSGRKKSNLSRTLKTLSNYGIVDLVREKGTVRPVVKATEFKVELSI